MSYNVRRVVINKDRYGVTHRYEIQQLNWAGGSTEILALKSGMNFNHEELPTGESILKLYENPVQKGSFELQVLIENTTDWQLIEDIFNGDEEDFRLVWKQDGVVFWTGSVLNDMLEYPEESLPTKYPVSIYAKDFSRLEGIDYTNTGAGRGTILEVMAELLNGLGYNLQIETITSWVSENTTLSADFLNQHYIDRYALQTYARTGDEENENITYLEALEKLCRGFCLVLKQVGGVFLLEQYSAYEDPTAAFLTVYNSDGTVNTATTPTDMTGNASTIIKGSSQTKQYPGLKSARLKYDHRTQGSNIKFPSSIDLDETASSERSFSQLILSDGDQSLNFSSNVYAEINESEENGRVQWAISAGNYLYDASDGTWKDSGFSGTNESEMVLVGPGSTTAGTYLWILELSINTSNLPADADGTLTVTLKRALSDTNWAKITRWENTSINIINAIAALNTESIDYKLTQSGNFSERYDHGNIWFGDGPFDFSRGAISTTSTGGYTIDDWQRRGSLTYRNFAENVLKEIMDVQRTGIKRTEADTELGYNPRKVKIYRGSSYVYGGGSYNGDSWSPVLVQINVLTAADTFEDLPRYLQGGTSASINDTDVVINEISDFQDSQKITTTTGALSGTVTSIPIKVLGKNFIDVGEQFYIFNLLGASLTEFTLAEPQLPDATTLVVQSKTLTETIVAGSWIVYTGDRVANYITQSDSGIRLGVRSYAQATTEDGEAYVDQDGNGYVFVDDGDQTAINQGTSAEIAILRGEIVLKATAGGQLALVRLDAKPESGSLVEIQADNINLQGLVTAINSGGSETEIDGGKIKADTSVVVGTGNNVAALTGAHATVRMYAGSSDPAAAPFRVLQDGTAIATKFVQLSGETVDGVIEQFSIKDLTITGALTIGTGGILKTAADETVFDADGISFDIPAAYADGSSLVWVSGTDSAHIGAYFAGGAPKLEYKSRQHEFKDENGNQLVLASATQFTINNVGVINIALSALPTTDPAIAGRVWDNNGSLSISQG